MAIELQYGTAAAVNFPDASADAPTICQLPHGRPVENVTTATHIALSSPLNLPPLAEAVVPGDRVVIAIASDVPQSPAIVTAVLEVLATAGVTIADVEILYHDRSSATAPPNNSDATSLLDLLRAELPTSYANDVVMVAHDPTNRDELSYLAADEEARPIYLNRRLTDADIVIPIGCCRHEHATGYHGIATGLHPTFSDTETLNRFRATSIASATAVRDPSAATASATAAARHRREVEQVAWLLGVQYAVEVIPAAGDGVLEVMVGEFGVVSDQASDRYAAAWNVQLPSAANLVIVAIPGGTPHQTWENLGQALATATRVVTSGGAIAVCCELADPPGPALDLIARFGNTTETEAAIRQGEFSDTVVATQCISATAAARVYLLSQLERDLVEDLGFVPVDAPDEIARLAELNPDCVILAGAQHVDATIVA